MKGILRRCLLAAVLATAVLAGSGAAAARPPAGPPTPATVASWPFVDPGGSFAESMALGSDALYVSHTAWGDTTDTATIERIPLDGGAPTTFVSDIDAGYGLVAGIAFDPQGRLYIAVAAFSDTVQTGVVRVETDGSLSPVLNLPSDAFPNGIAFSDGYMYVTDPDIGAVWRVQLADAPVTQTTPWLKSRALAPVKSLGTDGIAFRGNTLYLTQYDRGQILTTTVGRHGGPGPLHVLANSRALVSADGIAFDASGDLWVAANGHSPRDSGSLVVVSPKGKVTTLAHNTSWLDYPTQPVFAGSGLYLVNGSLDVGTPSVVHWTATPHV